jgi:hypothetical protein
LSYTRDGVLSAANAGCRQDDAGDRNNNAEAPAARRFAAGARHLLPWLITRKGFRRHNFHG